MTEPVSVVIEAIRYRSNAGRPSVTLSTRFCSWALPKGTGGAMTGVVSPPPVVPEPVWLIESSHKLGDVPSPDAGKDCDSAYESTVTYRDDATEYCWAAMDASRTVEKNDGPCAR